MDEVTYYNLSASFGAAGAEIERRMLYMFAYHLYTDHNLSMRTVCKRCDIPLKSFSAYVNEIRDASFTPPSRGRR